MKCRAVCFVLTARIATPHDTGRCEALALQAREQTPVPSGRPGISGGSALVPQLLYTVNIRSLRRVAKKGARLLTASELRKYRRTPPEARQHLPNCMCNASTNLDRTAADSQQDQNYGA
jgi:hypothetical protein